MVTDRPATPDGRWPSGEHGLRSREVQVEPGVRVRLVEAGPEDGVPAVLLHGWACSAFSFRFLIPDLAGAGYRVVVPDLMGHGYSDKPQGADWYSTDSFQRHATALVRLAAGERTPLVVAHSMGGGLALRLALRNADWFGAMALISPVGLGRVPVAMLARWFTPQAVEPLLPVLVRRSVLSLLLSFVRGSGPGYTADEIDEYWAPTADPDFLPALRTILHSFDWEPLSPEQLSSLATPSLVMLGDRDRLVPPMPAAWQGWNVLRGCGAEMATIPGAGHVVHEERPALVRDRVLAFARRVLPPG
jgi:pimeloyl-ACP methyl ester carboxylesterase